MLTRRRFLGAAAGLYVAAGSVSAPTFANARPKVVVVGGGVGGASTVRRLADLAKGALDITLVEPQTTYTTCFYSNLYLGGLRTIESLQHGYAALARQPGVTVVPERAAAVDRHTRNVRLATGSVLPYDRLVLSPGIELDYTSVPGWSKAHEDRMPHAWIAGAQTRLLKRQLDAVPDGGVIIVIAPPNPYRCPPGPYERVSMMAHALKSSGRPNARIIVLDPKEKFSKQSLFQQGWEARYPSMVEWMPPFIHAGILGVDPATMSVETDFETYRNAALVNVIPRQSAGGIAKDAGLASTSGFCPIDPFTMKSTHDEAVFVIGDAAIAGDMPKSAFAANSQALVAAQIIATEVLDRPASEVVYNNRCWSLIDTDDSIYVGGQYRPTTERIAQTDMMISSPEDSLDVRRTNYVASAAWYDGLTTALYR